MDDDISPVTHSSKGGNNRNRPSLSTKLFRAAGIKAYVGFLSRLPLDEALVRLGSVERLNYYISTIYTLTVWQHRGKYCCRLFNFVWFGKAFNPYRVFFQPTT